jgi:hypothetical protein
MKHFLDPGLAQAGADHFDEIALEPDVSDFGIGETGGLEDRDHLGVGPEFTAQSSRSWQPFRLRARS